jgi:mannose-6-phosphate isomerase class I
MGFAYKPIAFDDLSAINPVADLPQLKTSLQESAAALIGTLPAGLILLDGFPTANFSKLIEALQQAGAGFHLMDVAGLYRTPDEISQLLAAYLPEDRETDPELIFGRLYDQDFLSILDLDAANAFLSGLASGETTVLYGHGSAAGFFRTEASAILYMDVTPKDTALRVFDGRYQPVGNLNHADLDALVRQTYFIDTELAVRLRKELFQNGLVDYYFLDSELSFTMLSRSDLQAVMDGLKVRPLRAKPVYVEGVWGGQFIKRYRGVPDDLVDKVAWSFELIHTEASLLVDTGGHLIDLPFLTIMDTVGESLIGPQLYDQFDGSFPIRFNYDDTWHSNGNMSIQCHPNDKMAQAYYGDFAGQNEAYYVVLTGHDAKTFCGFKGDGREFLALCKQSETDAALLPYEDYIHAIPSSVGRQIFLPTGTVHGSGRNQLVLELGTLTFSAYTYKIYDYTRLDITGKPRPLHTKLAEEALIFERDAAWVMENIAFPPRLLVEGDGWRELLVGQFESIYFETHRIEMETGSRYQGDNGKGFSVITVVDGEAARIQSSDHPEFFYDAKYLDVVLLPASIQRYEVIAQGKQPVVLHKAFVREDMYRS